MSLMEFSHCLRLNRLNNKKFKIETDFKANYLILLLNYNLLITFITRKVSDCGFYHTYIYQASDSTCN